MEDTRNHVRPTNVYDLRNIYTNFNPCRQRSLSKAQSAVMRAAEVVGTGDLARIAEASGADGTICGCEVSHGDWEPQSERFDGCAWEAAAERDARTVRLTCRRGRKAAWLEVTYDDAAEAEAVIAAAGDHERRWQEWQAENTPGLVKPDAVYADIPF